MTSAYLRRLLATPGGIGSTLDQVGRWVAGQREKFGPAEQPELRSRLFQELRAALDADEEEKDAKLAAMAASFLGAADSGNAARLEAYIGAGFPLDVTEPRSGQTALHMAASSSARACVRALIGSKNVNLLARDKKGRLPSEMAYMFGGDPALSRWLAIKEKKQAKERGLELTRRGKG